MKIETDPQELGFDPTRLQRIDTHFQKYVDDGRLPGWLIAIARHGQLVHVSTYGQRDKEAGLPVETDSLFRIFSMSKPITSVAAMMLYEEGAFELKDPVEQFIPSFADTRVYRSGSAMKPLTEGLAEPIRLWHLLTHTSGLSYGFHHVHPVDEIYRNAGFEWGAPKGATLAELCDQWAALPLVFQPGSSWNYSVSTDVLGRVIEVVSGQTLEEFFNDRIFEPLGMSETRFFVPEADEERLAALYVPIPPGTATRFDALGVVSRTTPSFLSGGGGLIGTAGDYHRFAQMLLGEGTLDGTRLLSPRTVRFMTKNHLPGGADLDSFDPVGFAEAAFEGVGFGLGFAVMEDPAANKTLSTTGDYMWGGAASTAFWVDPAEGITGLFFTQLLPSSTYSIRPQLKQLVYQALVD